MNDKRVSIFISLVLRHKPSEAGVEIDRYGWVDVGKLINGIRKKGYEIDRKDLDRIVAEDEKQRYSYSLDKTKIRANQGHSIDVELQLQAVIPPKELYHGTGKKYLDMIMRDGIEKKKRQYVHLSSSVEVAESVGKRHGEATVLVVDTEKMYLDGVVFYRSENGVWLTEYVDSKYINVNRR